MNLEKLQEQIDRYLQGELQGNDLKAFEDHLSSDEAFAKEVQLQQEVMEAMQENDILDLSQKIKSVQQEKAASNKTARVLRLGPLLRIAATIAFIVAVYFVYQQFGKSSSPQELAAAYFSPEEAINHDSNVFRSADIDSARFDQLSTDINKLWDEANTFYTQKSFADAFAKLQIIEALDPEFNVQSQDEFFFYRGMLYYLTDRYDEALADFENIKANYTEKATWYKALAYLQMNQKETAANELDKILRTNIHPYKTSARQLRDDLIRLK